ncbi:MAG: TatD family hydrolase [Patescibacteria group bacterium]
MRYFDAHTHVHFHAFHDDYREAIARAKDAGVGMITVGTQSDTSAAAVRVAREFPESVWAAVGLHPTHTEASYHDAKELGGGEAAKAFTSRGEIFDYEKYKALALDPKTVAIGECGLDYYRLSEETKAKQLEVFALQIRLAEEVGKPLMVHCRDAFDDLIAILRAERSHLLSEPGVIHFFTGTPEHARALLDLGFSFTFGGVVTFVRGYDEAVRIIPAERILSETDAPYVAPAPCRGKRNEPAYVISVVRKLAELRGTTEEALSERIMGNVRRIFKIPLK